MGVIAFNPMLKAGYDVKLASGVITAGGTLGILIPPSVMIIVYAAVAGQSVVKLYAAAMFPGFFLAFLYLVYIIGWALINPKIAPKLPESETRVPVRPWVAAVAAGLFAQDAAGACWPPCCRPARRHDDHESMACALGYAMLLKNLGFALVPLVLTLATLWATWWYVVIHQQPDMPSPSTADRAHARRAGSRSAPARRRTPAEEKLQELGGGASSPAPRPGSEPEVLQQMGNAELRKQTAPPPAEAGPPPEFYIYFAFIGGRLRRCCCSITTGSWRPSSSRCCGC